MTIFRKTAKMSLKPSEISIAPNVSSKPSDLEIKKEGKLVEKEKEQVGKVNNNTFLIFENSYEFLS